MGSEVLQDRLGFVDALKHDISSYLAASGEEASPGFRATGSSLGDWLLQGRILCYAKPPGDEPGGLEEALPPAPESSSSARPFGAPPAPSSICWPPRPKYGDVLAAAGARGEHTEAPAVPVLPMSDSGSESDGFAGSDDGCPGSRLRKKLRRRGNLAKAQGELGGSVPTRDLAEDLLEFTSCFESGNLRYVLFDKGAEEYLLFLDNDIRSRGHTQWFYFAVRNAKAGRLYRLRLVNMSKSKSLFRMGMRPLAWSELNARRAWSGSKRSFEASIWDGTAGLWKPAGKDVRYQRTLASPGSTGSSQHTLAFDYVFESKNDCVFFAYYVPYTYSMLRSTLSHVASDPVTRAFCRLKTLAVTVGEARCDLLVISNPAIPKKMKKVVMVSSRVHPGESNASWLVHGLLGFLLSPSAEAQVLRDNFVWMVVPMLNPDGVISGNYRCGLCGMDLNRQWRAPHEQLHAPVFKLKKLVAKSRSKLCTYLDLHGHSRKCGIFAYACGQFAEDDHRRFTVRMYPKLLSLLIPEFNLLSCRWTVGKGKRGTGRVVVAKDLGVTNAYTIEASLWGSVDVNAAALQAEDGASGDGGEEPLPGSAVVPFTPMRLQLFGADLARALILQQNLAPMVKARLRSQRAWDGDLGGPWPSLSPAQAAGASSSPCGSGSSTPSDAGSDEPEPPEDAEPPMRVDSMLSESNSGWLSAPSAQGGKSLGLLDMSYTDILAELTSQGLPEEEPDSDSGGSDSAPSADNLEAAELQGVAEALTATRKREARGRQPKRKASRGKPATKRLTMTKTSSKKELQTTTGSRLRAKSLGTRRSDRAEREDECQKDARSSPEEPSLPRAREPVQRVVAFGQTTYLAQPYGSTGGGLAGRASPLSRTMPRLEDRSEREPPTLIRERERLAMSLRCDRGLASPPPVRSLAHIRHAGSCVLQSRDGGSPVASLEASFGSAALPKSPTGASSGRLAEFLPVASLGSSLDRGLRPKGLGSRPCSAGARLPEERRRSDQALAIKWLTWDSLGPQPEMGAEARAEEPPTRSWSCGPEAPQTEKLALATLRNWAASAVTATAKADLECSSPSADLALRPKRPPNPC